MISRRQFVSGIAGTAAAMVAAKASGAAAAKQTGPMAGHAKRIVELFQTLPGDHALYIVSPKPGQDFQVSLNPDAQLFCASAFKGFVLAKYLQMVDQGEANPGEPLEVDTDIWSPGSPVLTPFLEHDPLKAGVVGTINARTALDAMISRSDNTATDIMLRRVGANSVRQFIDSIGLKNSQIPDSTKSFFAYIAGAPNWQGPLTWDDILNLLASDAPPAHPILNPVQTMAVSPRDFVSFYSRALQGEFFSNPGVLTLFRAILSQSEAIPRVVPLGVNGFIKGGSIDFGDEHALSLAGGVFIPANRWAYFGMIINWTGTDGVAEVAPQFGAVTGEIFKVLHQRLGTC
jgi:beta-lactamase class A